MWVCFLTSLDMLITVPLVLHTHTHKHTTGWVFCIHTETLSLSYKHLRYSLTKSHTISCTPDAIMEEKHIPVLYSSYYYLWGTDVQDAVPHVFQPHQSWAFILHNLAVLPRYQFVGWEGQKTSWRENKVPSWNQENKWDRLCFLLFSCFFF